jgi:hypothetical protein
VAIFHPPSPVAHRWRWSRSKSAAERYEKAGRGEDTVGLLEKAVEARPSDDELTIDFPRRHSHP